MNPKRREDIPVTTLCRSVRKNRTLYRTKYQAVVAIEEMEKAQQENSATIIATYCESCKGWHIETPPAHQPSKTYSPYKSNGRVFCPSANKVKLLFPTEGDVRTAAKVKEARYERAYKIYKCKSCGGWHLSTEKPVEQEVGFFKTDSILIALQRDAAKENEELSALFAGATLSSLDDELEVKSSEKRQGGVLGAEVSAQRTCPEYCPSTKMLKFIGGALLFVLFLVALQRKNRR